MLAPLFTVLYYPVNRYVMLPRLGSGRPYVNMDGILVEDYFSANTVAKLLFYLLVLVTCLLSLRASKGLSGRRRAVYLVFCFAISLLGGLLFLEFSLWA